MAQPVRISWNDWAEQLLVHEQPLIEGAAEAGFSLALAAVPGGMGGLVAGVVGPTVVKEIVDHGLVVLEGLLSNPDLAITISPSDTLGAFVAKTFNAIAPNLAAKLGPKLDPMIAAAVAKAIPAAQEGANAPHIQTGR